MMDIPAVVQHSPSRPYPPSVLHTATPRSQVPEEIRIPLRPLLDHHGDNFLRAIIDWELTTVYCINLKHKDVVTLFDRYDRLLGEATSAVKNKAGDTDAEDRLELALRAGLQLIEYLRSVKFFILFKSADLMLEVFKGTGRFSNMILALDLLIAFIQGFRKKELAQEYLKESMFPLMAAVYICALNLNVLSIEHKYDAMLFLNKGEKIVKEALAKCEVTIDLLREYHLNCNQLEEFEHNTTKNEKVLSIIDLIKCPISKLEENISIFCEQKLRKGAEKDSPLRYALRIKALCFRELQAQNPTNVGVLCLKATTLINLLSEDKLAVSALSLCQKIFSPAPFNLSWDFIEDMLVKPVHFDIHLALLQCKWAQIQSTPFDQEAILTMHSLLQRVMSSVNRLLQKEQTEIGGIARKRKRSVEQIESMIKEEGQPPKEIAACTEEKFVASLVDLARKVFLFEDRHVDGGIQSDYSQIFDLASGYLSYLVGEDRDYYRFGPRLIGGVFELLKLDMGASPNIVQRLLDLLSNVVSKPLLKFKCQEGMKSLTTERLNEYLVELIELVDSLFVDPTKNFYIAQISQYAREVGEHVIWITLADLPTSMEVIYNPIVVFLDDILTEMPENLVNPTLKHIAESGLQKRLIDNFLRTERLDFELIGFFVQFLAKNINCPFKTPDFDEKMNKCLEKAFQSVLTRSSTKQNIKRFSGADSTNSLVVLAEEVIDLVNVKGSMKDLVVNLMGQLLDALNLFYQELWKALPKIVKGQKLNNEMEFPMLHKTGWLFQEDLKDNFIFLERLSQNLVKFFSKYYDIHRTNLHKEFDKIDGIKKFLNCIVNHTWFEGSLVKQRKFIFGIFSRMINQPGNEAEKTKACELCFTLLEELCNEYLELFNRLGEEGVNGIGHFLYKSSEGLVCYEIFNNITDENRIRDILLIINKYHAISVISELLKGVLNFSRATSENDQKTEFEAEEDAKLKRVYPLFVQVERSLINLKVKWFMERIETWPENVAAGKLQVTFDEFSDYCLGATELFSTETNSKAFERIIKNLNNSMIDDRTEVLKHYTQTISKILSEANTPEELTMENAFYYARVIQTFAYMMSSFDGITILITLKECGVLKFCTKAIIFGLRLIVHNKENLFKIKSIREVRKPDAKGHGSKPEMTVNINREMNNLKYILETLCPRLMICWKLIGDYFQLQKPEKTNSREEEINQREAFNAARFAALCALKEILANVPPEIIEISDKTVMFDEDNFVKEDELRVLLKNISSGFDTLRHIHTFVHQSSSWAMDLLPKFANILAKAGLRGGGFISEDPRAETLEIREESLHPQPLAIEEAKNAPATGGHEQMDEEDPKEKSVSAGSANIQGDQPINLLTDDQFVAKGKKTIKAILDDLVANKISMFDQHTENFSNVFINLLSRIDSSAKKNLPSLINTLGNKLQDIRNYLFYKQPEGREKKDKTGTNERDGPATAQKEPRESIQTGGIVSAPGTAIKGEPKYRISKAFIKEFKSGNFTTLRSLNVILSLLTRIMHDDKDKNLIVSIAREHAVILGMLSDILQYFPKLLEIKTLSMEPEFFRRRYNKVLEMTAHLLKVSVDFAKKNTVRDEPNQALAIKETNSVEPAQPGNTVTKKPASARKYCKVKEKCALESIKKDLILAASEYLAIYPQYIKQKVNIINAGLLSGLTNLFYYLSQEKGEFRELIRSTDILKKLCRAGQVADDTYVAMDVLSMRGFLALVDDQTRTERLIEESVKTEVKHYFKVHKQVQEELKSEESRVNLIRFDVDFKDIYSSCLSALVKVSKEKCEIHSQGGEKFIEWKEDNKDKDYIPENESTSTVFMLMKEIIRSSSHALLDRSALGQDKTPVKQIISLTYLIETLSNILTRYPLLYKFVISCNFLKTIKKLKNPWIKARFEQEYKDNSNINFLQFFVRVVLFVDFKNFKYFMFEACRNSYVMVTEKTVKGSIQTYINSGVRRIYFKETLLELQKIKEELKLLKNQREYANETTNELGVPNRYHLLRLCSVYSGCAQELGSMIPHLKFLHPNGEINLYLCQKTINDCIETFTVDAQQVFEDLYEVLSKSLFFLMKMNFLCHANKAKLLEHDSKWALRQPGGKRPGQTIVYLNDFGSFRSRWPDREAKQFKRSMLLLHAQSVDPDKLKDAREPNNSLDITLERALQRELEEEEDDIDGEDGDITGDEDDEDMADIDNFDIEELVGPDFDDGLDDGDEEDDGEEEDDGDDEDIRSSTHSITNELEDQDDDIHDEDDDDFGSEEGEEEFFDDDNEELPNNITPEQLMTIFDNIGLTDELGVDNEGPIIDPDGMPIVSGTEDVDGEDDRISDEEAASANSSSLSSGNSRVPSAFREGSDDEASDLVKGMGRKDRNLRRKEAIKDALSEVSKKYPLFIRTDVAGLMYSTFIDWQLNEFYNVLDIVLEEWESNHVKDRFSFKENIQFFYKLRDAHRKESLVLKNLYPSSDSLNSNGGAGNKLNRLFSLNIRDSNNGNVRIRSNGEETRIIIGNGPNNDLNIFELFRRGLNLGNEIENMRNNPNGNRSQSVEASENGSRDAIAYPDVSLANILLEEMQVIHHSNPKDGDDDNKEIDDEEEDDEDFDNEHDPLGIAKYLQIETNFNFREYGLKPTFLQKNKIDPLFFSMLEEHHQLEIILGYLTEEEKVAFNRKWNAKHKLREPVVEAKTPIKPEVIQPEQRGVDSNNNINSSRPDSEQRPPREEEAVGERLVDYFERLATNQPQPQQTAATLAAPPRVSPFVRAPTPTRDISRMDNELGNEPQISSPGLPTADNNTGVVHNLIEELPAHQAEQMAIVPFGQRPERAINQENVNFVNSLTPNLREEILMTSPDEFINSLTQEMIDEARQLRLFRRGHVHPGNMFRADDIEFDYPFGEDIINEDANGNNDEEDEAASWSSKSDDKNFNQLDISVFLKINKIKENLIEGLLSSLYSAQNPSALNYNLLSVIMANYNNQSRIYDALLFILEYPRLDKLVKKHQRFPPRVFSMYPNMITSYSDVYKMVSQKILVLLNEFVEDFHTFFLSQPPSTGTNPKSKLQHPTLSEIHRLRQQNNLGVVENGFFRLIELAKVDKLFQDKESVRLILSITNQILQTTKKKRKELDSNFLLDQRHVDLLCQNLSNDSLEDRSLTSLSSVISLLCTDPSNLNKFISEMKRTLSTIVDPMGVDNKKLLSMTKEAKRQGVMDSQEFLDVLTFQINSKRKEKRLIKVFKTIEHLFEKYFEVYQAKNNAEVENKEKEAEEMKEQQDEEELPPDATIDEETKKQVRSKFSYLLEDQELFKFWLDLIELLKYFNDEGVDYIRRINPQTEIIQPLVECFFISFKILKDDDHITNLKLKSKGIKKPKRKKSVSIANLVDELEEDELVGDQIDFEEMRSKKFDINDLFAVMCEANKVFINYMVERDLKLLSTSFSCILKVNICFI